MKQKGSSLLPVIIIIALVGVVGYLVYQNIQLKKVTENPTTIASLIPEYNIFDDKSLKINYFPVQYETNSNQQQKVAQTFTPDKNETIQSVELKASFGVGGYIKLDVYQVGNVTDLTKGKLVGGGTFNTTNIVKEVPFEIVFNKPIQLEANKEYSMVIYAGDKQTQTAIAFSENDSVKNGLMYEYTRLTGGNGEIINQQHSWQPDNSQDLLYKFKIF